MNDDYKRYNLCVERDCEAYQSLKLFLKESGIDFEPSEYGRRADGIPLTLIHFDFKSREEYDSVARFITKVPEEYWHC